MTVHQWSLARGFAPRPTLLVPLCTSTMMVEFCFSSGRFEAGFPRCARAHEDSAEYVLGEGCQGSKQFTCKRKDLVLLNSLDAS